MANELVPFKASLPAVVSEKQLADLEEVAQGVDFLPRIQLVTKGKYVDTGKIAPGHYGVPQPGGEEIEDLGEKIDVIPLAFRAKALDVSDKDAIITVYDTSDPEFARIKNSPKQVEDPKTGKKRNSGCMWGPSFLVLERGTGKLYELFFGNKSGRQEAGKLRPFLPTEANGGVPSPATLKARYVETPEYGWHVPVIVKCSEPFDQDAMKVDDAKIHEELEKFLNPEAGIEKAEEQEEGRAR